MTHAKLLGRITARPDVFGGKPIVRDMRISVELILSLLAQGATSRAFGVNTNSKRFGTLAEWLSRITRTSARFG